MDQIYRTVPKGAVVTKEELSAIIKSKGKLYAVITSGVPSTSEIDKFGPPWLLVVDTSKAKFDEGYLRQVAFSDTPRECESAELSRFSIGAEPMGNYFFTNYWHAYAYRLRTEL